MHFRPMTPDPGPGTIEKPKALTEQDLNPVPSEFKIKPRKKELPKAFKQTPSGKRIPIA